MVDVTLRWEGRLATNVGGLGGCRVYPRALGSSMLDGEVDGGRWLGLDGSSGRPGAGTGVRGASDAGDSIPPSPLLGELFSFGFFHGDSLSSMDGEAERIGVPEYGTSDVGSSWPVRRWAVVFCLSSLGFVHGSLGMSTKVRMWLSTRRQWLCMNPDLESFDASEEGCR
jgi:hypothetical protein